MTLAARLLGVGMGDDSVSGSPAGTATRAELAQFQVRVEAQLAQILYLVQPGAQADAGATAEPPHARATPGAARRERAGDGAATSGNDCGINNVSSITSVLRPTVAKQ